MFNIMLVLLLLYSSQSRYANAYMAFFKDSVLENGTAAVFEEYLFSPKFNFDPSLPAGKKQAQMLNRLMSTLFHPLIHMGYGAEFSLPGMIIEGEAICLEDFLYD